MAVVGHLRFASNRHFFRKTLTRDEFALLLKNSFSFLKLVQFKDSILFKMFERIDKDHNGLISYDEYLDWVKSFLAVPHYFGDEFYVEEDDEKKHPSEHIDPSP
jgi:Ca2+-binding EF-hand superfamily protein